MIAGQGTIGLEILRQHSKRQSTPSSCPSAGGGLIAGNRGLRPKGALAGHQDHRRGAGRCRHHARRAEGGGNPMELNEVGPVCRRRRRAHGRTGDLSQSRRNAWDDIVSREHRRDLRRHPGHLRGTPASIAETRRGPRRRRTEKPMPPRGGPATRRLIAILSGAKRQLRPPAAHLRARPISGATAKPCFAVHHPGAARQSSAVSARSSASAPSPSFNYRFAGQRGRTDLRRPRAAAGAGGKRGRFCSRPLRARAFRSST